MKNIKNLLILLVFTLVLTFTANAQVPTPNVANGSTYCVGTTKIYGDISLDPLNTYNLTVSPSEVITPISSGTQFQITWNTAGTYTLTLTETTPGGCINTYTSTITVTDVGTANPDNQSVCEGYSLLLLTGTNLGTNPVWSGTGVVLISGIYYFDSTGLSPGTYNVTVNSTNTNGCPISGTAVITITPTPTGLIHSD